MTRSSSEQRLNLGKPPKEPNRKIKIMGDNMNRHCKRIKRLILK